MLSKRVQIWSIIISSIGVVLLLGKGWVHEYNDSTNYLIAYHIMGYSIAPCFALVAAIVLNNNGGFVRQYFWSIFAICLAEMIENTYCRIPSNEVCNNDYFTTFIVFCTIIYGSHKLMKSISKHKKGMLVGFGFGFSLAKTLFSKLWWGKLFAALTKIFSLWF